jgi:hypothetical protein
MKLKQLSVFLENKPGRLSQPCKALAIEIPDCPGGMANILAVLEPSAVNIEYMYAFTLKRGSNAILIARIEDADRAIEILHKKNVNILSASTFFALT